MTGKCAATGQAAQTLPDMRFLENGEKSNLMNINKTKIGFNEQKKTRWNWRTNLVVFTKSGTIRRFQVPLLYYKAYSSS